MDQQPVLVVAGDPAVQQRLTRFLQTRGLPAVVADTAERAAEAVSEAGCRFTLFDHGAGVLERLKAQARDLGPIIGVTPLGHDDDLDAAIARRLGSSWRPPRAADGVAPQLRREMSLWRSPKMREVREILREAAGVDVTVLITGETGTGKDVVAQAIHALSARRTGPFVKVNCAAVPRELLETELFGHERGAFTGAHRQNIGKFESAHLGTIFLDEIGDLHPALQAKLLHVLQDGGFSRVGGKAMLKVDVRVVAATNQVLEKAVADGRFREDLYYRLNVVQVQVPPLRERLEEVPALVDYFVERYSKMFRREGFALLPAAMDRLLQHRYPGNVRELENLVKRMIVLGDPEMARTPFGSAPALLAAHGNGHAAGLASADGARPARLHLKEISHNASLAAERGVIAQVLEETGWNRVHAAKALKISYRALLYKMKRTGLHGPRPAPRKESRHDA
jgi:two-component system response regulator AtoC